MEGGYISRSHGFAYRITRTLRLCQTMEGQKKKSHLGFGVLVCLLGTLPGGLQTSCPDQH